MLATAGCSSLGLVGLLDVDMEVSLHLLLGLSSVVMKGYDFGQVGGSDGHAGVLHKFSRITGAYPPSNNREEPFCATGPLAPTTCPPPKKKVRVLGMGCGHLASASELNLKQVGARGSASRGHVLPIPPSG